MTAPHKRGVPPWAPPRRLTTAWPDKPRITWGDVWRGLFEGAAVFALLTLAMVTLFQAVGP